MRGGEMAGKGENANASPTEGSETVPPTRATGSETATGLQIAFERGEQTPVKGKERGSQVEIDGGDPTPDVKGPQKPRGLQAEPALFVSNGSISSTDVASPTGLVPVGAVATSVEHGKKLVADRRAEHEAYVARTPKATKLDEATVGRLGRAELAALGKQRGYDMPEAGTRATRAAFLAGQEADKTLATTPTTKKAAKKATKSSKKSSKKGK